MRAIPCTRLKTCGQPQQCLQRFSGSARARFASSSSTLPEHVVLPMPALSPTMARGGIARWHLAIGD